MLAARHRWLRNRCAAAHAILTPTMYHTPRLSEVAQNAAQAPQTETVLSAMAVVLFVLGIVCCWVLLHALGRWIYP